MDKLKSVLAVQSTYQQKLSKIEIQCGQDLERCYQLLFAWLSPYLTTDEQLDPLRQLVYLSFPQNETLLIRLSSGWVSVGGDSFKSVVYLSFIYPDNIRFRAQLQLHWQEQEQVWRVIKWKRPCRWFSSFFYRRTFSQRLLEKCLLDFLLRLKHVI